MNARLEHAYKTISILERKLSDAREAIIESPKAPKLSADGERVTLTKECYNNILAAINPKHKRDLK